MSAETTMYLKIVRCKLQFFANLDSLQHFVDIHG